MTFKRNVILILSVLLHLVDFSQGYYNDKTTNLWNFQNDSSPSQLSTLFEWQYFDYEWPNDTARSNAFTNKQYIPENIVQVSPRFYRDKLFLAMPRFRRGVPATLVTVELRGPRFNQKLNPFKGFEESKEGDCNKLQNVIAMEIDKYGRMWVIDIGRLYIFSAAPDNRCPAKLVLYDLNKPGYPEIHRHTFSNIEAPRLTSFTNDIALHEIGPGKDDWVAYISESSTNGGILVYFLDDDRSYKVEHWSMKPDPSGLVLTIEGVPIPDPFGVNGITYYKKQDRVIYCALGSYKMYSISGAILRNRQLEFNPLPDIIDQGVEYEGKKSSQSDGITSDCRGRVYYGLLNQTGFAVWDSNTPLNYKTEIVIAKNDKRLIYVIAFAVQDCNLIISSDRINRFLTASQNLTDINFRIMSLPINADSYLDSKTCSCEQPNHIKNHPNNYNEAYQLYKK